MLIEIAGLPIHLIYKQVKNINLRITTAGEIKVSASKRIPIDSIYHFIEAKYDWIIATRERLKQLETIPNLHQRNDHCHFFLGKLYPFLTYHNTTTTKVTLENGSIQCCLAAKDALLDPRVLLHDWYHQQMKEVLPALIAKWESIIGVKVLHLGIKVMKTRWGSCNVVAKRIWLNLHLIQKPLICLEYVLVHEMVHLLEASHNRRFHALMTQFMPDWPLYKKILNNKLK